MQEKKLHLVEKKKILSVLSPVLMTKDDRGAEKKIIDLQRGERQVECTKRNDEFGSLTISGFLLFIICNKTFNNNDGDNNDQAVCSALHSYALNCLYIFVLCLSVPRRLAGPLPMAGR